MQNFERIYSIELLFKFKKVSFKIENVKKIFKIQILDVRECIIPYICF